MLARAPGDDHDFELVIHHLAVARPHDGRARPRNREPVGDVVDRKLAIDRRQVFQGLRHHRLERLDASRVQRLNRPRSTGRLTNVQRKRHRVPHLSRLRQRGKQLDVREIGPEVRLAAAFLDERARKIEASVVGVGEVEHRGEGRGGGSISARRSGEVEEPARLHVDGANSDRTA